MSEPADRNIAEVMDSMAPPSQDPVFRCRVLKRREQRQFQRRMYTLLAGAIAAAAAMGIGIAVPGLPELIGMPVAALSGVSACLAFRHELVRILRHSRI